MLGVNKLGTRGLGHFVMLGVDVLIACGCLVGVVEREEERERERGKRGKRKVIV